MIIIQTGDPVRSAYEQFGNFSDWFIKGLGLPDDQVQVINVHQGETLPQLADTLTSGVLVTGSAAMVTEHTDWMTQTQQWLETCFELNVPTLGVCFGHQLIADILGGRVDYNPQGRHMGLSAFNLTPVGQQDWLLGGLNQSQGFNTFVSHLQSVLSLPESVAVLGSCEVDANHAFCYQEHIWGVQFHPEWSSAIMAAYLQARSDDLVQEGFNPTEMIDRLKPCNEAERLLHRFATYCQTNQRS